MGNKIIKLSWESLDSIVTSFAKQIKDQKLDFIVTVARGGFVPSVIISHKLGLRDVITIEVKRTLTDVPNSKKIEPVVSYNLEGLRRISGKRVLLIDDIVGSGETLKLALNLLNKYKPKKIISFSVIHNENNFVESNPLPDYIGKRVRGWIVFPWE